MEAYKQTDVAQLDRFSSFLREELDVAPDSGHLLSELSKPGKFYDAFVMAVSALSVEIAYHLRKLASEGYREDVVERLSETANHVRNALSMSIRQDAFAERFRNLFLQSSGDADL